MSKKNVKAKAVKKSASKAKAKPTSKVKTKAKKMSWKTHPTIEELMPKAKERAETQTLPCPKCNEQLTAENRSITPTGKVIHIGCPKSGLIETVPKGPPVLSGLPKHGKVKPPKAPPPPPPAKHGDVMAMADYQGRTCIQLERGPVTVTYVPLDVMGLHLTYMPKDKFDARFQPLRGYPVEKAVKHYIGMAVDYGATKDVCDRLSKVVKMSEEEVSKALLKLTTHAVEGGEAMANGKAKKAKNKVGGGIKKPGSGARIREMLLKGVETEEIVKAIHKEFAGAKTSASTVAWYKNDLRKKGLLKSSPKAAAAKKAAPAKGKAKGKKAA